MNLYWPGSAARELHDGIVGDAARLTVTRRPEYNNPNLGSGVQ